jgi:hypothetical protein
MRVAHRDGFSGVAEPVRGRVGAHRGGAVQRPSLGTRRAHGLHDPAEDRGTATGHDQGAAGSRA